MNLKEEILKTANGNTVISITAAAVIAESYAKEKAWEVYKEYREYMARVDFIGVAEHEIKTDFNEWWEETK